VPLCTTVTTLYRKNPTPPVSMHAGTHAGTPRPRISANAPVQEAVGGVVETDNCVHRRQVGYDEEAAGVELTPMSDNHHDEGVEEDA